MASDGTAYTFRPATAADLPLLSRRLRTPLVVRWWGAIRKSRRRC